MSPWDRAPGLIMRLTHIPLMSSRLPPSVLMLQLWGAMLLDSDATHDPINGGTRWILLWMFFVGQFIFLISMNCDLPSS